MAAGGTAAHAAVVADSGNFQPRSHGPARAPVAIGGAALLVLAGGVVTVLLGLPGSAGAITPAAATSPQRAVEGYYQALEARSGPRAFALLCPARQAGGYHSFALTLSQDLASGTGIRTWTRAGSPTVRGHLAAVPGHLVLTNGTVVAITVVLQRGGSTWRVCGSDLGGILPAPGGAPGAAGGGSGQPA